MLLSKAKLGNVISVISSPGAHAPLHHPVVNSFTNDILHSSHPNSPESSSSNHLSTVYPYITLPPPKGHHHHHHHHLHNHHHHRPGTTRTRSSGSRQWPKKQFYQRKFFFFLLGLFIGVLGVVLWSCASNLFSDNGPLLMMTTATTTTKSKGPGSPSSSLMKRRGGESDSECKSPMCMQAAGRILSRIKGDADPCSDFYQFACGRFLEKNEVPDDSFQRSTLQEMMESILVDIKKLIEGSTETGSIAVEKAKQLYNSCMHNSFRTSHYSDYKFLPIYNVLHSDGVGLWPILETQWNQSEFSLERLLAQLFSHQVQNLFEIYVAPDELDPTKYLLEFDKGKPAILKTFFLNSTNPDYVKYVRSYKRLLIESVLILSHGKQGRVTQDVDAILQFESSFAKLVESSKCHFDGFDNYPAGEEDYGRVTLNDIQERIPQVNWTLLLQSMFDNLNLKENVSSDMIVYFHCSEFFPGLISLLEATDKRTVSNYLIWRFVFRYFPFLGNKFLQIWMEFMKDVPQSNANEERLHLSRWKQCASIVNDGFGMAMANLYVHRSYKKETESKIKEMILYLKKAFRQVIREQDWLAESFKDDLVEKLMKMGSKIGYPPYIMNEKALEKEYEGLEFNESSFLLNILKMRKFEVVKEIRKVHRRGTPTSTDWYIQPLVANAFHNPTANEIVIPLGILRYPMYDDDYPMYLNFANLGIVLAHEITHGFDQSGRHYDKDGNFTSWWPDEVHSSFKTQAICFADQYGKYKMPLIENYVDGNETLADNVCDNAALRHAWLAYQMWTEDHQISEPSLPGLNYTLAQIFYTSFGQIWCEVLNREGYQQYIRDTHSPGQFRAWGVTNNRDFGSIFNCPVGSAMNPKDKCVLWS